MRTIDIIAVLFAVVGLAAFAYVAPTWNKPIQVGVSQLYFYSVFAVAICAVGLAGCGVACVVLRWSV